MAKILSDDEVFGSKPRGNLLSDDDVFGSPNASKGKSGGIGRIADVGISALKGAIAVPEAAVGLADLATGGLAGKAAESIGFRPGEAKQLLSEMYSQEQQAANRNVQDAEGFVGKAKAMLENPSTIAHGIVESLPSMAAGGLAGRAVAAGAPVVGAAIGEGLVGAGSAAEQMRQGSEDGTLSAKQTAAAIGSGIGTGALGLAGGKVAQKLGVGDIDTAIAAGALKPSGKGLAARTAGGVVSEGVLEEMPQSMQEQAWQNVGTGRPILEGVPEAGAQGLVVGGVMGGGFNAVAAGKKPEAKKLSEQADQPTIAGLLPSPTYTGTPNAQILQQQVEQQNAVDAAQASSDALWQARQEEEARRAAAMQAAQGPDAGPIAFEPGLTPGVDVGGQAVPGVPAADMPGIDFTPTPLPDTGPLSRAANLSITAAAQDGQRIFPFTTQQGAERYLAGRADRAGYEVAPHPAIPGRFAILPAGTMAQQAAQSANESAAIRQEQLAQEENPGGFLSRIAGQVARSAPQAPRPTPEQIALGQQSLAAESDQPALAQAAPVKPAMILTKAGKPWPSKGMAAANAKKNPGYSPVQVQGGWALQLNQQEAANGNVTGNRPDAQMAPAGPEGRGNDLPGSGDVLASAPPVDGRGAGDGAPVAEQGNGQPLPAGDQNPGGSVDAPPAIEMAAQEGQAAGQEGGPQAAQETVAPGINGESPVAQPVMAAQTGMSPEELAAQAETDDGKWFDALTDRGRSRAMAAAGITQFQEKPFYGHIKWTQLSNAARLSLQRYKDWTGDGVEVVPDEMDPPASPAVAAFLQKMDADQGSERAAPAAAEEPAPAGMESRSAAIAENIRLGNEAMSRVITEHVDVRHAMERPGRGGVTFVWGKEGNPEKGFSGGFGIAKIIAKRTAEGSDGESVARKMVEVIAKGEEGPVYGPKGGERVNVSYDGHTAVLALQRFGDEETWLLTGWDDVVSDGAGAGNATDTYAPESSGMRTQEGADPDSSIASEDGQDKAGQESISAQPARPLSGLEKARRDSVQRTAAAFAEQFKGAAALDIRVVFSREEIPQRHRPSPYAEGVYHDKDGVIYLVARNLPTKERAWQVLMHEAVGHYSLANMMGEKFSSIWPTVLEKARAGKELTADPKPGDADYATVEAVRRMYPEASDDVVAQEVLARMAETMNPPGWFRITLARIRHWIGKVAEAMGIKMEASLQDARDLVALAAKHLQEGRNLAAEPAGLDMAFASESATSRSDIEAIREKLDSLNVKHFVSEKNGVITLHKIVVPEGDRGAGKGSAAMQSLIDYADKTGQAIVLSPSEDFGGNKKRLVAFYKRFGFVENKGRDRAFSASESMYRNAPGKLLESRTATIGESKRAGGYTQDQRDFFARTGRTIEVPTMAERIQSLWKDAGKKLAQGIVDQFAPLKDLGGKAYTLARLSKGSAGAFEALLHHGKLSIKDGAYDADTSGGVVEKLFTPLHGEGEDFLWWVAANRAERLAAQDRENLFTPADIAAGKSLAQGGTDFDYTLQHGPRAGQTTRDRALIYRDALKTFDQFNRNAMDMAEQSGLIDGASRQYWESEFYVPFYRVSDEDGEFVGAKMGNALVRQQAFKHLKGGTDKLNSDLLANTLQNWAHLIDAAAKNRAAKASLEAAARMGAAQPVAGTMGQYAASNGAMLPPGTKKTVWFMDGGQKQEYKVDDPYLMTAINSLEFAGLRGPMMDVLSKFKHWLTIGVTVSPAFKVRNLIRDSIQAIGTSGLSYNPVKNIAEGWKATDRESQDYVSALASGGLIRFGTMLEGKESDRVRQLVKAGVKDSTILDSDSKLRAFYDQYLEPAIAAYNELGNRGEEINRAALYKQLTAQGVDHATASLMARDLMDFSLQGAWTGVRFLSQVVPFMNARLQGLYKLGRAANEDPARFSTVLGATAMFSIALMAAYGDDDEWKRREDWDRDSYWWFKFGGVAFRIPKPFEIGAIATLAERGVEYFASDEMTGERFMQRVKQILLDNLSMNPVPQLAKPIIDIYSNKDGHTGRPLETMGMEKLQPEYRFNQNTSMVARGMSTATGGAMSPIQIDHLVRGYFGWLGTFVIGGADMLIRPLTNEPTRPAMDPWKFVSQGFLSELPAGQSRYVSQMYDQAKELEQAYGTYRQLLKEGKVEEAKAFGADHADELRRYKSVESVKKAESNFNAQIRMIERSGMDPDEKRVRILEIQQMKDRVARMVAPGVTGSRAP